MINCNDGIGQLERHGCIQLETRKKRGKDPRRENSQNDKNKGGFNKKKIIIKIYKNPFFRECNPASQKLSTRHRNCPDKFKKKVAKLKKKKSHGTEKKEGKVVGSST